MIPFILKALKLNIYITGAILALMVLILSTHESQAQRLLKGEKISSPNAKTKQAATKTSTINTRVLTDTIRSGKDSLSKAATDSLKKEEGLQTTVTYSASDSTIMDTEKQIVYLYGDATVKYGDISLQADYIQLNWDKNEVYARGTRDSSKVRAKGKPVFTQGSDKYDSEEIRYNFKSKKAIIQTIITKQGDGFIHGGKVKKDDEDNLYISDAVYTTCNLLHPHFSIRASRIKVVGKKEIVSGPFRFELNQIPIPLPLPFGFFPYSQPKESGKSGIIVPTYGEEPTGRGFYLRDGGYYWAASPNIGVRFTGQIYSKGGWGLGVNSQYVRRYRYAGNFNLAFTNNSNGSEITPQTRQDFSLQWAHSPQSRGNSSFSASVNIASNSYNQNNSYNTQNYISNTASSSVQYTKNFGQTIRTGISLRVNQNTTTKVFDAGTDFNFGLNQFQPFKKKNAVQERFIDQFRFGLNFNGSVSVTNVIANATNPFDFPVYTKGTDASSIVRPGDILTTTTITDRNQTNSKTTVITSDFNKIKDNAISTLKYDIPISLPNIKLTKYINLTPGMSLSGNVYTREYKYSYVKADSAVKIDTIGPAFKTPYQLSFSASMNTRLYGTMRFTKGRLQGIRHTMVPSISFSYTPDYTEQYYQNVRINNSSRVTLDSKGNYFLDKDGKPITSGDIRRVSIFDPTKTASLYGAASGSIGFGINNTLEAKVKSKSDTAAKESQKITLIDNFGISGSYNLIAQEYNLSNLSFTANSRVQKFDINLGGSLDPYLFVQDPLYPKVGRRVNEFMFSKGQGLARLQNFNFSLGRRFSPHGADKPKESKNGTEGQLKQINKNINDYVDWNVPWSFNFSYQFSLNKNGLATPETISGMTFQGDLSITEKWKFSVSSGFDFKNSGLTYTNLTVHRDLHCWEMNFNWTPVANPLYGRVSNYSFDLRVKSSLLQELKLSRRNSFYDRGGF